MKGKNIQKNKGEKDRRNRQKETFEDSLFRAKKEVEALCHIKKPGATVINFTPVGSSRAVIVAASKKEKEVPTEISVYSFKNYPRRLEHLFKEPLPIDVPEKVDFADMEIKMKDYKKLKNGGVSFTATCQVFCDNISLIHPFCGEV